jgi:elongation factor Ts
MHTQLPVRIIESYAHKGRVGVLVEFGLETSIVSRADRFQTFCLDIAMHIAAAAPADIKALLDQRFVKDPSISVGALLLQERTHFRERIEIMRFVRWDQEPDKTQSPDPPHRPAVALRVVR